jgi:thiol-disulfide isomerase/thioredoxin
VKALVLSFFVFINVLADVDFKKELASLKAIGSRKFDQNEKAELILIDFWASWCDPCKESFPYYEVEIKNQKKKILFVSVNLDDKVEKAESFLKEFPQSHVTIWDDKKKLMGLLNFDSIPHMLILDKDWKLLESIKGFNNKTKKKIKKYF